MTSAARDKGRPPRGDGVELALCALLCLVVLGAWAFQYHPFLLPNNDYYSFERLAQRFAALEAPRSFKRMPIFPGLMALVAPLFGGPHAYLHAALVLNQVFSIGTLLLLFSFSRGTIGPGAVLVPTLFATTIQFHAMGLQPLVEPSLGFFVVATFELMRRRSAWQYLAAACAALSRYEAGMLIPVIVLTNALSERRLWRNVALGVLACSGALAWLALGAWRGEGGGFYLELMEGMGWRPAPGFLERSLREPFRGWAPDRPWAAPLAVVAAGGPMLAGGWVAARRFPREGAALAAFFVLCVGTIVVFGVNKARYVYPTQWIPLLFWVGGTLWLVREAPGWLAARATRALPLLLLLAPAAALAALAAFGVRLVRASRVTPLGAEVLLLGLALGIGAVVLARETARARHVGGRRAVLVTAIGAFALWVPLPGGGLVGKQDAIFRIHHANHSAWVLARWLEERLGPEDRVLLLPRSHITHLTRLEASRFDVFSSADASTPEELAHWMDRRRLTIVAYTHRGPVRNPAQAYYHRLKKVDLAELFRSGDRVPGFDHVATLPLPEELGLPPVQVYRRQAGDVTSG